VIPLDQRNLIGLEEAFWDSYGPSGGAVKKEVDMPNGAFIPDQRVEEYLAQLGLVFHPGRHPGTWLLPFHDPDEGTHTLVIMENGQANENFLSVFTTLTAMVGARSSAEKALALANGFVAVAKYVLIDDRVLVRSAILRGEGQICPEMLRNAVQVVLAAAKFIRPILQACLQGEDPEKAFERRVGEVTGTGFQIGPPRGG